MSMDPLLEAFDEGPATILASDESCLSAAAKLESVARYVAQHLAEREDDIAELRVNRGCDAWSRIGALWEHLAIALQPSGSSYTSSEDSHIQLALALAKLHRNLLAGLESHQRASVSHEPSIRAVLFNITTFARIEDMRYHTLQAVTTQLLSNLISPVSTDPGSDEIVNHVLPIYLSGGRSDDIVIRLLDSSDPKTNLATLTLIANSIRNSEFRQNLLLSTQGVSWISKILDKMDSWNQSDDGRFELGYTILEPYLSSQSQSRLFDLLSDASEPITPSQTTLLKLLDPYIVSPSRPNSLPSPHSFLIAQYHRLTSYALGSITSGRDDPRLPKVFEGLILICESLSNIGLAAQTRRDRGKGRHGDFVGDEEMVRIIKSEVQGEGIVPPLIGLLRELDRLLPRVRPGRRSGPTPSPPQPEARIVDMEDNVSGPILQIKQHLLQLLSVITYQDIDVGDQVRACGGVELVLSLTEFDESNPLLRERALFVVRNLLLNNPANQAIISKMDPVGIISDETGEILPLPEKMRKTNPGTGHGYVVGADHDNGNPL